MNSDRSQVRWLLNISTSLVAASLPLTSSNCAYAHGDRSQAPLDFKKASQRAVRQEAREIRRETKVERRAGASTIKVDPVRTHVEPGRTAILFPGQLSTFHTSRPRSTYTNDAGNTKTIRSGLSLDLSSTSANITVGTKLLLDQSITIDVGGNSKTVQSGSKLTAAEYAALTQKLATGSQGLVLSSDGSAESGTLNLNSVSDNGATIRATTLVIPESVTVTGDFARTADGVRVTKDIQNFGSILAVSSDAVKNTAVIAAKDINNADSGSISSQSSSSNPNLNLALRADRDLNNLGSITSAGDLELSAGRSINNHGLVTSAGDVTLTTPGDAKLLVNNYGGVINAGNSSINVRNSDYNGVSDSIVFGGNLLSSKLNMHAGQGTANLMANEVTGVVSTTGLAAHVSTNTADLMLGEQCLTGDPTYYNTGNIILGGDVIVGEALAIIAGGNITTNQSNLIVRARDLAGQGYDIHIIAGANITAGSGEVNPAGGPATLPAQAIGSISQNATDPVTISGASLGGGNVDFTGAGSSLSIVAGSSSNNFDSGNVTIAAFANAGGDNGRILTNNSGSHAIFASGNGTGNNGNVSLIAGATSGQAIQIGAIQASGGTGQAAGTGNIVISNTQPTTSDGLPITFGTDGSVTSGNALVPSTTLGGGSVTAASLSNLNSNQNISITSGATTTVGTISSQWDKVSVFSAGNLSVNTIFRTQAGELELLSRGDITFFDTVRADDGILVVASGNLVTGSGPGLPSIFTNRGGNTGNVSLVAGADFTFDASSVTITGQAGGGGSILFRAGQKIQQLRASSSDNGNAGDVNLIAFNGTIELPIASDFGLDVGALRNGTGTQSGNISIVAGADVIDAILMGGANQSGGPNNYNGSITISSSTPNASPGNPVVLSRTAGFAGVSSGTFLGGAISPNASVNITRGLVSNGAAVTINGGGGGVFLNDVTNFGNFQLTSLGDITVEGGVNVTISGSGENQNTLIWTALGNISFDNRFLLHATGGGGAATGGGGGIALVAGGTVQSVENPFGINNASIQTTSGFHGGNIAVVAGASFSRTATDITILGPSGSGGSILFDGTATAGFTGDKLRHIDSHSLGAGFDGGDITLISFGDLLVNPDAVGPDSIFFSASGHLGGSNGTVTIVTPGNLILPTIDMAGGRGGAVIISSSTPSAATFDLTPFSFTFASLSSGSFLNGPLANNPLDFSAGVFTAAAPGVGLSIATAANLTVGNIDVRSTVSGVTGGFVTLRSGGNVSAGTINTSNTSTDGAAGQITIITDSTVAFNVGGGGSNGSGVLTANAGTTSGDGGGVSITNTGTGGIVVSSVPTTAVVDGDGATLELLAPNGILDMSLIGTTVARNAAGADNSGGKISLSYNSLVIGAGVITLSADGTGTGGGGSIFVQSTGTGGGNDIVVGAGAGQYVLSTAGAGGAIELDSAAGISVSGSLDSADFITLRAANDVVLTSDITTLDIRVSAGGDIQAPSSIVADPITLISAGNILIDDMTADGGILIVAGGNITPLSNLNISAFGNTGGNVVMIAGASFVETDTDVTITGASATGGNIDLVTTHTLGVLDASGTDDAGNVTLMAFENVAGTGRILLPFSSEILYSSNTGNAGTGTIIGSASSGFAVSIGTVNNVNGNPGTGSISIAAAAPVTAGAGPIQKADASYAGAFTAGALSAGSIAIQALMSPSSEISVVGGGSILTGNISSAASNLAVDSGDIFISSGAAGSLSTGLVTSTGLNTVNAGSITIVGGSGAFTPGTVAANGVTGNGGIIIITADSATPLAVNPQAQGALNSGSITVRNAGSGGIEVFTGTFLLGGTADGGNLTIDAAFGPTHGQVSFSGPITLNGNAGSGFQNGNISILGSDIVHTGGGGLSLQATGGLAGTGTVSITTTSGGISSSGVSLGLLSGGDVNLNMSGAIDTVASTGGLVTIISGGDINGAGVDILSSATGAGNNGGAVTLVIATGTGGITIGDINAIGGTGGQGGNVSLTSRAGGTTFGSITTSGTALVTLASENGDIIGASVNAPSQSGGIFVNTTGGTAGDTTLTGVSNVGRYTGAGGGAVTIDNGANAMRVQSAGASQSLIFTTTNTTDGIFIGDNNIVTSGTVEFYTPKFSNSDGLTAASILIESTGDLLIDGTGGTLVGTTPAAGPPGSPSTPRAIVFNTGVGSTLTIAATMSLTGDAAINNPGGTTVSNNGSLITGNNNVVLTTNTWTQIGTGNITGNNFILAGLTLVNSDGDVTLAGNLTFEGRDLAIIAQNNVHLGNFVIDLSSTAGNAGNLTIIAGFDYNPSSGGQKFDTQPYTLTGPSAAGGNITGTATINTSSTGGTGHGGTLLAVANGGTMFAGTISLGDIATNSNNGDGGSVFIVGDGGVTTGDVLATGGLSGGDVLITVAQPQTTGAIVIEAGTISGGAIQAGPANPGSITTGLIDTGSGSVRLETGGNMTVGSNVTGTSIALIASRTGTINLATDNIFATQVGGINGGSIMIVAGDVVTTGSATLTLNAEGAGPNGNGGSVTYITGNSLNVGAAGDVAIIASGPGAGGAVSIISDDDITIEAGGIDAFGDNGDGARLSISAAFDGTGTLTLIDTDFLKAANVQAGNGNGGEIRLSSQLMAFDSSSADPLVLSANALGVGDGGLVEFINADPIGTFIGAPAKAPKPPANFLSVSARGGVAGGNGGAAIIQVGGNLTISDTSLIDTSPAAIAGNWRGGGYSLESTNVSGKAGLVVITGNLSANGVNAGDGGSIDITASSKKAFQLNLVGKTPKNGISGLLSADGPNGSIRVTNNAGGVQVLTSNALEAEFVTLTARLKGAITANAGVVIRADNTLRLESDSGSIGKKPLSVLTPHAILTSTLGSVNVSDAFSAGTTTLGAGSGAGKNFTFESSGPLDIDSVATANGSIFITGGSGLLRVLTSADVTAINGGIVISNSNVNNGQILIDDNAQVITGGKGKNVVIAIGSPPKKGTVSPEPAGVNPFEDGGTIFYGNPAPGGGVVVVGGGTANINAINKDVIFNNASVTPLVNQITLGDNTTITADPPARAAALLFPLIPQAVSGMAAGGVRLSSATPDLQIDMNMAQIGSTNGSLIELNNARIKSSGNQGNFDWPSNHESANLELSLDCEPVPSSDLTVSAAFHCDEDAGQSEFAASNLPSVKLDSVDERLTGKHHFLTEGNVVYAPSIDMTVKTPHGEIKLGAGSIVLVAQSQDSLSVYNLYDRRKNAVVLSAHNKRFSLSPGRHVVVTSTSQKEFADVNPIELVQYRGIDRMKLDNGWQVFTTEFALPSACYAVRPLARLMQSKHHHGRILANRILKTTAVLMALNPDSGDFVQYFKRQMTAMNRN